MYVIYSSFKVLFVDFYTIFLKPTNKISAVSLDLFGSKNDVINDLIMASKREVCL